MVVSHLVRLECRVLPLRNDDANLVRRFDIAFDAAEFVPMPPEVFDLAAELRARNRIKTPDALHLAAAIHNGCDEFWTNDDRLASLNDRIAMRVFR
jgi:predicted nucleic acid-binding protein